MQPRVRIGLIVGVIGLVLNVCVAGFFGVCGPLVSLLGGGVAGFFAAQQEHASTKSLGARYGAIAGAITGGLILIGQMIGGVSALAFMQYSGIKIGLGAIPTPSASPAEQAIYYLSGAGTVICIGLIGVVLAALVGAGAGYMTTQELPTPPISSNPIN